MTPLFVAQPADRSAKSCRFGHEFAGYFTFNYSTSELISEISILSVYIKGNSIKRRKHLKTKLFGNLEKSLQ